MTKELKRIPIHMVWRLTTDRTGIVKLGDFLSSIKVDGEKRELIILNQSSCN